VSDADTTSPGQNAPSKPAQSSFWCHVTTLVVCTDGSQRTTSRADAPYSLIVTRLRSSLGMLTLPNAGRS
jgi:hypothetical protein